MFFAPLAKRDRDSHEVITLIRVCSDVSYGLIMLVTYAELGAPLIQQHAHCTLANRFDLLSLSRTLIVTRRVSCSEQPRKIPAPAINSVCFVPFRQDDGHVCPAEELCPNENVAAPLD